jgi:mono/diheme cytochrome c family protein
MRKFLKILGILVIVVIVLFAGFYIYMLKAFPKIAAATDMKIESSPQRLERGKYLVTHVVGCIGCHSERNFSLLAGPITPGTEGKGGELFDESLGFPGSFYSKNITPAAIGNWTDGELFRAITSGVNKDGEALFPLMPYLHFGKMDEEDINSVIAYIRTLKPVTNEVPKSKAKFPMSLIMRTIPAAPDFQKRPDKSNTIKYGEYLVNASSCIDCHSQAVKGKIKEGMEYAGGFEFQFKNGYVVRSANITPDEETGIGKWTKEIFIAKFKSFDKPYETNPPVKDGEFNTYMPWTYFGGMTTEDLGAIYDFLRTLKPVSNKVEKFSAIGVTR